jgi:3-oxoacyl-[acyl-carrier protein] reductase
VGITGGSSGIGKVIASEYLSQGALIYLLGFDKEGLDATQKELSKKGTVHVFLTDVSKPEEVKRAAEEVEKTFGTVDVLVNGAGIYGPIGPVTEVDPDLWRKAIEVNLYGTFLSVHFIVPLMKNGAIINFVGGGEGAFPNFSSYVSGKGGIARFTETVAAELEDKDITMNAIAPGAVNTKFLDDLLAAGPEKAGKKNYERALKQKAEGGTPPENAAALCVFLASEEARGITGKIFSAVWDPYEAFPKYKDKLMGSDVYTMRRVRAEWLGLDLGEPPK